MIKLNKLIIVILVNLFHGWLFSTDQVSDTLIYHNIKCEVFLDWTFHSPLEVYFINNKTKSPFQIIHTGNYRGHIATWELYYNQLYLKRVNSENGLFQLNRIFKDIDFNNKKWASWFTGLILISIPSKTDQNKYNSIKYDEYHILEIKYGLLIKDYLIENSEITKFYDYYLYGKPIRNSINKNIFERYRKYIRSFHGY